MNLKSSAKRNQLFLILGSFFVTNALIAECIGVKIFSLEKTLGFQPLNWMVGDISISFHMTAGVLLWPVVFIMTDIINEYFGHKAVRFYSILTAILVAYSFGAIFSSMALTPSDFWIIKPLADGKSINMNEAYNQVFGQGLWIIIGSLSAFVLGQLVDVHVFHRVRKITGDKHLWLRSTVSTLVSQLIDSFVVLFIAFYIGKLNTPDQWSISRVFVIASVNYVYKFLAAWVMIPVLYFVHKAIDAYLGKELAEQMIHEAANPKED